MHLIHFRYFRKLDWKYRRHSAIHTQLYSPSQAAAIKKQTKQRKRSEIKHCKIN